MTYKCRRKYKNAFEYPTEDGIYADTNQRYCVAKTCQTVEELNLYHSSLPALKHSYQMVLKGINILLIEMRSRTMELENELPLINVSSIPCENLSVDEADTSNFITKTVHKTDIYSEYLRASSVSGDPTMSWPPTIDRLEKKYKEELVNACIRMYRAGELAEASVEPHLCRKAHIDSIKNTKLSGISSRKPRIIAKYSAIVKGDPRQFGQDENGKSVAEGTPISVHGDFPAESVGKIVKGWMEEAMLNTQCERLLNELLDHHNSEFEQISDSTFAKDERLLPWFMPKYPEPYAPNELAESILTPQVYEHLNQRNWIESTQSYLDWCEDLIAHVCANE